MLINKILLALALLLPSRAMAGIQPISGGGISQTSADADYLQVDGGNKASTFTATNTAVFASTVTVYGYGHVPGANNALLNLGIPGTQSGNAIRFMNNYKTIYLNPTDTAAMAESNCDLSSNCNFYFPSSGGYSLLDYNTSAVSFRAKAGLSGIGTLNPWTKFHVSSGTNGVSILVDGNAAIPFQVGISSLIFTSAGDFGLGTAAPASKLHMSSGTLTIDGSGANLIVRNTGGALASKIACTNCSASLSIDPGSGDPGSLLFTEGGASRWELKKGETSDDFQIQNEGATDTVALSILRTNSYVGMNTDSPTANLDVNGSLRSRSSATLEGYFLPWVRTKAQIDALAGVLGAIVICSDCTVPYDTCKGTGTALSGWRAETNSAINTTIPGTLVAKGCGSGQ